MKIKIDFQLSKQFNFLERLIFRFVVNGFADVKQIVESLPIFSDAVIANAIKHLVNQQLIVANKQTRKLSLSDSILAIINKCHGKSFDLEISSEFRLQHLNAGNGLIVDNSENTSFILKKAILSELLPGICFDTYLKSIDFVLYLEEGLQNE